MNAMHRILTRVALEPATMVVGGDDADEDRLVILRHTLMNPDLMDHDNGISDIDLYLAHLARRIRALLGSPNP